MLILTLNVVYVLLAIGMTVMILMQRGSGAQAGAGFGGGASATVFGARGASNFLSQSTKWMAVAFFGISLYMAWHVTREAGPAAVQQDLGVMAQVPAAPAANQGDATVPAAPGNTAPGNGTVPAAPGAQPAEPASTVPAAPAAAQPSQARPEPSTATPGHAPAPGG